MILINRKRKIFEDEQTGLNGLNDSFNNSQNQPTDSPLNKLNINERQLASQIANQISSKIMIKLDQINLKVNQISDRLYELERKFDSFESI